MKLYDNKNENRTKYLVNFMWDEEANVWIAICDEIPLALESESLDELINRVRQAAPEIIELNKLPRRESVCYSMSKHEKMVFA